MQASATTPHVFTSYQKLIIAVLAFLQFTIILDFMIMSPLGAVMMPALQITPTQFGFAVSVYAFSAGVSGFLAAGFADRFDRKKLLLFFYTGFVIGTFLCAIASSYHFLLAARMITGLFGGVIGAIVMAITTDLFPLGSRGRVMGFMQTSFAASQVLGIPIGLFLSNHWGWHAPFLMIVAGSILAGIIIFVKVRPVDAHLKLKVDKKPLHHLLETISTPRYLMAFATTALLSTGGFMIMPFGSAYTVHNLGIDIGQLPLMYLITGLASIFMGPLIGKASDSFGKFRVFVFGAIITIIMVLVYTNLGPSTWPVVVLVNTFMFVGIFSRMIPSQALMSAIPHVASRGAFMSVSSSLQQVSGGLASMLAGLIVAEGANGRIEHFDTLGFVMAGTVLVTIAMMYHIVQTSKRLQEHPHT